MRFFEHVHVVGFEETNLVGNVYFANHVRWQGRVRELFLRERCPEVLFELTRGLALVTVHCSCDYLEEIEAFDEVAIRMRLGSLTQSQISLLFEYWRSRAGGSQVLAARGEQLVACMRRDGQHMAPCPVPPALREALRPYGNG